MMFRIRVELLLGKNIESVFAALSNHEGYGRFPGVDLCELLETGGTERDGEGALRRVVAGRFELRERIVRFERPTRMDYRIESAKPIGVRHDRGEIRLSAEGSATRVVWISEGAMTVPLLGPLVLDRLVERRFGRAFERMLRFVESESA